MRQRLDTGLKWALVACGVFLVAGVLRRDFPFDKVQTLVLVIALICAGVLAYRRQTGEEVSLARAVIAQFFISIALPILALLGLPLIALSLVFDLDTRLWQAVVAGVFIATGWLTAAIFSELEKKRAKDEKLRDYHKALYAEIGNALQVFWDRGKAEEEAAQIIAQMEATKKFVPLIPREHHDFVYDSLVDEIEVLPRVTIDAVVAYYSLIKAHAAQVEDMRGEVFRGRGISQERRILMYQDYFETRKSAFALGQYALRLIKEYAENGPDAADALAKALSNPDAAPSGPSRE